jgi:hypothetical protein
MNVIANTAWNLGKPMHGDPIITIASQVENIKTLAEAEDMIRELTDASNFNLFKLGGAIVRAQELFDKPNSGFEGYENFRQYLAKVVYGNYGIRYDKAMHAARIYRKLRGLEIPWSAFGNIGWTKVVMLLDVVTKDNVEHWVAKATEMNNGSLKARVEAEKQKGAQKGRKTVSTKIFKLHEDQKELVEDAIAKMKAESGTQDDSVALEYIMHNYMGAGIQFQNWEQALTYAAKQQSDDPPLFMHVVVKKLEELFPGYKLDITLLAKDAPQAA